MDSSSSFVRWHKTDGQDGAGIAKVAFESAKKHFEQSNSLSEQEKELLKRSSSLKDVQEAVACEMAKYKAKTEQSKSIKCLQKFSETICHYSQVLDIFVQHHSEYVALVWGTMKLLFMSAVNHAETLELLSNSLLEVAQRLPRVEVLSMLYPTKYMHLAVESLYAAVLDFLLIAHSWSNESKLRHAYHSFTRPHEIRYKDLLERITDCTNTINELADVGAQTEIRVMHTTHTGKLNEIVKALQACESDRKHQMDGLICSVSRLEVSTREIDKKLDTFTRLFESSGITTNDFIARTENFHSMHTSAQLDTNQKLSELQLSQALHSLSQHFEDPEECLKHHIFLRNRRVSGQGPTTSTNEFWRSPRLATLSLNNRSSLVIIMGTLKLRSAIQDFGVSVVEALSTCTAPTLWALTSSQKSRSIPILTTTDLVKYLTYQALKFPGVVQTEKQMPWRYSQIQTSRTLREWLTLFKQIIGSLGGQVYMVVDLAMVGSLLDSKDGLNFIKEMSQILDDVSQQEKGTKIKMVLLAYEPEWLRLIPRELSDRIIPVMPIRAGIQRGKEMRNSINRKFVPARGTRQTRRVERASSRLRSSTR